MWLHEHTWTVEHTWAALGCRPNSTFASRSTLNIDISSYSLSSKTDFAGVPTMKRLDQGHLYPKLEVPRLICLGRESNLGLNGGRQHSAKSYSNSMLIAIRKIYIWAHDSNISWLNCDMPSSGACNSQVNSVPACLAGSGFYFLERLRWATLRKIKILRPTFTVVIVRSHNKIQYRKENVHLIIYGSLFW